MIICALSLSSGVLMRRLDLLHNQQLCVSVSKVPSSPPGTFHKSPLLNLLCQRPHASAAATLSLCRRPCRASGPSIQITGYLMHRVGPPETVAGSPSILKKRSCVDSKDKDVQCRYNAIIARLDRPKEELKNVEEELVKCEGEMAISLAEEVQRDKLYCEPS
ncbi:hypothetical protein Tco_0846684 [Tanacetum coccineum]